MGDTIVEEVRRARDDYARRFNYDLHAICADLRREQELSGSPIVSFPKRPVRVIPPNKAMLPTGRCDGKLSPGINVDRDATPAADRQR